MYTIIVVILWERDILNTSEVNVRIRVSIEVYDESEKEATNQPKSCIQAMLLTILTFAWIIVEILLLTDTYSKPRVRYRATQSLLILTSSLILSVCYVLDLVIWGMLSGELAIEYT